VSLEFLHAAEVHSQAEWLSPEVFIGAGGSRHGSGITPSPPPPGATNVTGGVAGRLPPIQGGEGAAAAGVEGAGSSPWPAAAAEKKEGETRTQEYPPAAAAAASP
jgi:hypothetical protein